GGIIVVLLRGRGKRSRLRARTIFEFRISIHPPAYSIRRYSIRQLDQTLDRKHKCEFAYLPLLSPFRPCPGSFSLPCFLPKPRISRSPMTGLFLMGLSVSRWRGKSIMHTGHPCRSWGSGCGPGHSFESLAPATRPSGSVS